MSGSQVCFTLKNRPKRSNTTIILKIITNDTQISERNLLRNSNLDFKKKLFKNSSYLFWYSQVNIMLENSSACSRLHTTVNDADRRLSPVNGTIHLTFPLSLLYCCIPNKGGICCGCGDETSRRSSFPARVPIQIT